jgi:hypothetical protein
MFEHKSSIQRRLYHIWLGIWSRTDTLLLFDPNTYSVSLIYFRSSSSPFYDCNIILGHNIHCF